MGIVIRPTEALQSNFAFENISGTNQSYIQILGISGTDIGGVHRIILSDGLTPDDNTTITSPKYKNASGITSPLVDGTTYNVSYNLYDGAGNLATIDGPQA